MRLEDGGLTVGEQFRAVLTHRAALRVGVRDHRLDLLGDNLLDRAVGPLGRRVVSVDGGDFSEGRDELGVVADNVGLELICGT